MVGGLLLLVVLIAVNAFVVNLAYWLVSFG